MTTLSITRLGLLAGCLAGMVLSLGCRSDPAPPRAEAAVNQPYVIGALAYQRGEYDKAQASLMRAVEAKPDLIMAQVLLGHIHREKEDYEAAARRYKIVVGLDPYLAQNHYNLGLMYHYLYRLQEAAASYKRAVELSPNDFSSNMNLGLVYDALGQSEQGLAYSRKATQVNPRSAEAWANLGVVLDSLGQYAEAESAYRRSVELNSERIETQVNLAGNLLAQGKHREAAGFYEVVVKRLDTPLIRQRYGRALLGAARFDQAAVQFGEVLKSDPKNWRALSGMGDALLGQYKQGTRVDEAKRAGALTYWRRSLEVNPDQAAVAALVKEYEQIKLFAP